MSRDSHKWYYLRFGKKTEKSRKVISIILSIIITLATLGLIAGNGIVMLGTSGIRIQPQGFGIDSPTNTTIVLNGTFNVQNDHFFSLDIRDIKINFTMFTDNSTEISGQEQTIGTIPRLQNKTINILLNFSLATLSPAKLSALNNTAYMVFDVSLSLKYFWYDLFLGVKFNSTI
jgi:LEA14-like dessication related protein